MKRLIIPVAVVLMISACNTNKSENGYLTETPSVENEVVADSLSTPSDTFEKLIKTADMRFKVKDVLKTKMLLSNMVVQNGGMLTSSTIESQINNSNQVKVSKDSVLEIKSYTTNVVLSLRLPSKKVDEFMNQLIGLSRFINNQNITIDDKTFEYLSNSMKTENRIASNLAKIKSRNDVKAAIEIKDQVTDKIINNLVINRDVEYSNITLNFYQDNAVSREVIANDDPAVYQPSFINRAGMALAHGWELLTDLILFLLNIWGILLLVAIGILMLRRAKKLKLSV